MKKGKGSLISGLVCLIIILSSCSIEQEINSSISETTINRLNRENFFDIPFENEEVLKSFSDDPQILDYNIARRLALIQYIAAEFDVEMGWEGCKMNPVPVVIYGFDNRPKFYDFIFIDAEEQMVGTITVYARRSASTSIRNIYSGVKDYRAVLTKAGDSKFSMYEDWMGQSYTGLRGKAGETPDLIINTETNEIVTGITEIEGNEIINAILKDDFFMTMYTEQTSEDIKSELLDALYNHTTRVNSFWTGIDEILPIIESLENDDEITDADSKTSAGILTLKILISQFNLFHETRCYIDKYTSYFTNDQNSKLDGFFYGETGNASTWCGPWVVSYLVWIKNGRTGNKYYEALSHADGIFGLKFKGEPMSQIDLNQSLKKISNDNMSIKITGYLDDEKAYNQIKNNKKPAVVYSLSNKKGDNKAMHWNLAVGARISAGNYYFLFHDNYTDGMNGHSTTTKSGFTGDNGAAPRRNVMSEYTQVEWWNRWFNVND